MLTFASASGPLRSAHGACPHSWAALAPPCADQAGTNLSLTPHPRLREPDESPKYPAPRKTHRVLWTVMVGPSGGSTAAGVTATALVFCLGEPPLRSSSKSIAPKSTESHLSTTPS